MTPEQISQMMDRKIQSAAASGQFNLNRIPYHVHNGKDSPFAYLPTLTYAGFVKYDGKLDRNAAFPSGWSATYLGTGSYRITHNLNSLYYIPVVTQFWSAVPGPTPASFFISGVTANRFQVDFFDSKTQAAEDTGFLFLVTHVTNTKPGWPLYVKNAS